MKQYIIIGNSAAGIAAVEAIRKKDKSSKVIVVSDEPSHTYCRCLISYYLSGQIKEDKVYYRPGDFYQANNIEVMLGKKAARLDVKKSRVILEDKTALSYDALLIATGSSPKFPEEIKGIKKTGVFGFRTIRDAKDIEALLPATKSVCILGGGLIGLKCAHALIKRKVDVKVIIKSNQVLSQMLDAQAASLLTRRLEANGTELIFGQDATEIIGEGDIRAVKLASGKVIGCSLVVIGKGVSPNLDLAKEQGINVNEGILCNNLMQTNVPNIYVAGDVCESMDVALGKTTINALWPVAVEQGKIAGANIAGDSINYEGSVGMNSIEFFGLPVLSLGVYRLKDVQGCSEMVASLSASSIYKKLIIKDDRLIGAILVGDVKNSGLFLRLIRERISIASIRDRLLSENFCFADIADLVKDREKIYS